MTRLHYFEQKMEQFMTHVFNSKAELAAKLCANIDALERTHFQEHPNDFFVVAVAGGSLPSMLKDLRPSTPAKWKILLADERIVPSDHEDSNTKLLYQYLPIPKENIITINPSLEPAACALDYESKIKAILPLNLALLGMGPDGHICSLFPNHPLLKSTKIVDSISDSPKPPPKRVTLTFPILNNQKTVRYLVATGATKKEAIKGAIEKDMSLPVSHLSDMTMWLDSDAVP